MNLKDCDNYFSLHKLLSVKLHVYMYCDNELLLFVLGKAGVSRVWFCCLYTTLKASQQVISTFN